MKQLNKFTLVLGLSAFLTACGFIDGNDNSDDNGDTTEQTSRRRVGMGKKKKKKREEEREATHFA